MEHDYTILFGQSYDNLDKEKQVISAMKKQRVDGLDMTVVETTDLSKESTQLAMEQLLTCQPDAIITFNDYVHMDAVQYAVQKQIRINKDITFVSYANLPITGYMAYPPLASIEQYPYSQGKKAMELMIKILNDKSAGPSITNIYYIEKVMPMLVMHSGTGI